MNEEQIAARGAEIEAELVALNALPDWTDEQSARFAALNEEIDGLEQRKAHLEERRTVTDRAGNLANVLVPTDSAPQVRVKSDPYDMSTLRYNAPASELRGRAITAVEQTDFIADRAKAAVVKKIERTSDPLGVIPGLVLHTGNPHYQSAFHKGLAGRSDVWTTEEREAMERAQMFRTAMGLTDGNGGYGIPFTLDPTLIMTDDGSANPFRQISRVVTVTTDTWNGLSSAGVTASFDAEATEVSDDSPTFSQPSITTRKAQAFVRGSIEISQDYRNLAADLQMLFQDAKDDLEALKFVKGVSGSNEPIGLQTALDGTSSELAPATAETFAAADVYKPLNNLPAKYRGPSARVNWLASIGTINAIRQFAQDNYDLRLATLAEGTPERLLGYPLREASAVDSSTAIDTGATADHFILFLGDFRHYVIVDRVGMAVEFIPHLFAAANNLPSGQRGWYAYWRVGADSVNDNAFRVLSIPTAA